jgi:hypothetical protein
MRIPRLPRTGPGVPGAPGPTAYGQSASTRAASDNQDNSINDRPAGLPRNSARGPRFLSFDFNISKAFFFGPSVARNNSTRPNVNVFANMTNAFNWPNYNPPSGVMTSPNFGRSTSAGNPREVEIGLRFQF